MAVKRRLSPGVRKLALAAHVVFGGAWLGIVSAMLVLEIVAITSGDPDLPRVAYLLKDTIDRVAFPPAAVATLLTGVLLALGTAWGLFRHYWIVVKLALTLGVIVTGIVLVGGWLQRALSADPGPTPLLLIGIGVAHLLMLGSASVISVYKPWGQIRPERRPLQSAAVRGAVRDRRLLLEKG